MMSKRPGLVHLAAVPSDPPYSVWKTRQMQINKINQLLQSSLL